MISPAPHPRTALYSDANALPLIPCCDHYAGSEKLIRKSLQIQAPGDLLFDITCDLEDGAGVGNEQQLRELVVASVNSSENKFQRVGVRIHDPRHSGWQADVRSILVGCGARLSHMTIPKVGGAAEAARVAAFIDTVSRECSLSRPVPLHFLIETHGAVREVWDIARIPNVRGLDFGLMDFVSEHHGAVLASAMQSPEQFTHPLIVRAKTEIVAAATAFGKIAAHNVTTRFSDTALTRSDARVAREQFGFLRMWSVHPAQIPAIIEGMRPTESAIAEAAEIIRAGWSQQWAPIRHQETLHDRASYRYFWELLERAFATGAVLPEDILKNFFASPRP